MIVEEWGKVERKKIDRLVQEGIDFKEARDACWVKNARKGRKEGGE